MISTSYKKLVLFFEEKKQTKTKKTNQKIHALLIIGRRNLCIETRDNMGDHIL